MRRKLREHLLIFAAMFAEKKTKLKDVDIIALDPKVSTGRKGLWYTAVKNERVQKLRYFYRNFIAFAAMKTVIRYYAVQITLIFFQFFYKNL